MKKILTIIASIALLNGIVTAQDSVYIYKLGAIQYKEAITKVDSVVFHKAAVLNNIVSDIDGNSYKTIVIGKQTWMAENLRTAKYNDNTVIPNETSNSAWTSLSTAAQCTYNTNNDTLLIYGRYYNWYAVESKKLCPLGWHVPTDFEWNIMVKYLDNTVDTNSSVTSGTGSTIGGVLKDSGLDHWTSPNTGATNASGFNAMPTGFRYMTDGTFIGAGGTTMFWSSSAPNTPNAWTHRLWSNSALVGRINYDKHYGFPVRCIKD
jgi:uncharacterized protein (TIGR02145 family)